MHLKAKELAQILKGRVEGDPDIEVHSPSKIEEGGEGTISFLGNLKYESYLYTTTASIVLVNNDFVAKSPVAATLIRVDDVYAAIALLLERFQPQTGTASGVSSDARVHAQATIEADVSIGSFTVVEANARIGAHTRVYPQVYIGKGVKIGSHVTIYPGVRVLDACEIGDHCIIHSNAVIGADGFGFAPQSDGSYKKIAQIGNVVLESHVEIGANTCIDRATMGSTIIRSGGLAVPRMFAIVQNSPLLSWFMDPNATHSV